MLRATFVLVGATLALNVLAEETNPHFNQVLEAAQATLGTPASPRMAYLPREVLESPSADGAINRLCGLVASAMTTGRTDADDFVIASVNDQAQMRLLQCIDQALGGTTLPKLRLVYVGSRDHETAARSIVESWGSTFFFLPDPERHGAP
jgi:hypothetical protein